MKKIVCALYFVCFILNINKAQNLIPNGDFEFYTSCPTGPHQVNLAFPWYDPNGATSDYYNSCATLSSEVNVPFMGWGPGAAATQFFQNAHSGNGYAGFFSDPSPYREYVQVKLIDSLLANNCYVVEFYTNLANHNKYAGNNIGAYISNTPIYCSPPNPYNLTPQILNPGNLVITDTLNWVKVQGLYTSIGGEQYITIGNLDSDANTTFIVLDTAHSGILNGSYYNVDDVSMYAMPTAKAGRDTTICHGDAAQLGVNNYNGVTYNWQPVTGLSNATIGNPKANPTQTTTYYLTQTTPCGVTRDTVTVTLGECTFGINELKDEGLKFQIVPNPNDGNMTLEYNITESGTALLSIYDITDKLVKQQTLNAQSNKTTIVAEELKPGVYFYTITINESRKKTNKLIIIK